MNVYSLLTQHHLVSIRVNMHLATDYKQFSLYVRLLLSLRSV